MIVIYTLLAMGCILIASGIWLNFFRELPSFPAHPVDIDPQKGRVKIKTTSTGLALIGIGTAILIATAGAGALLN